MKFELNFGFKRGLILWDLAIDKVKEKEQTGNDELCEEKNVLFVGSHDAVYFKFYFATFIFFNNVFL